MSTFWWQISYTALPCTDASPEFISKWGKVLLEVSRTVTSMRKLNRAQAKCKNCGIIFTINKPESGIRTQDFGQSGMFHSRECMIEYRETHKTANAMKNRILELNKRGRVKSYVPQ